MRSNMLRAFSLPVLILAFASTGFAAPKEAKETEKKPEGKAYIDPEKAGPDFKTQGEYLGAVAGGNEKLGCQVVAQGEGMFLAVFLPGGLPGEGSDSKNRVEVKAKTDGDKTIVGEDGKGYSGVIANDSLIGKTDKGASFELKKIVRHSPEEGAKPPAGAVVLFDGTNTDAFKGGAIDERQLLKIGAETLKQYSDFTLHVEFILPFKPAATGQGRGNSGIYIQKRYEIQVLDSFGLPLMPNYCGSVYTKQPPLVNMCYPPLTWQTYDIDFTAARYDAGGNKAHDAVVTVKQNGVLVQDHYDIAFTHTGAGKPEDPKQAVQTGPIYLQDHGNPVFYRNVWIVDKGAEK